MTAPKDVPDRIWAQTHTGTNRQGRWSVVDLNVYAPASKYVRADIVDELAQALERLDSLTAHDAAIACAALARYRGGV